MSEQKPRMGGKRLFVIAATLLIARTEMRALGYNDNEWGYLRKLTTIKGVGHFEYVVLLDDSERGLPGLEELLACCRLRGVERFVRELKRKRAS